MLRVRLKQLDALSRPVEENLEFRLSQFVQANIPGMEDYDPDQLQAAVRLQIGKARAYGMETESDIAIYVSASAMLGAEFDIDFPAANELLESQVLPGSMKADWLADWCEAIFQELERSGEAE